MGGWERVTAFTGDKIPANLSTLQPQRQNSSVEIGDRGVGYRGEGGDAGLAGGWTVEGEGERIGGGA